MIVVLARSLGPGMRVSTGAAGVLVLIEQNVVLSQNHEGKGKQNQRKDNFRFDLSVLREPFIRFYVERVFLRWLHGCLFE